MTQSKLVADTPLQQITLTLNPILHKQCATRNRKHTTNVVSFLRASVISYVLNADSGRYTPMQY